jgi:cyclic pyranopterin phosphate synthase
MPGHVFPERFLAPLMEDARDAGYRSIRLYGGEPLIYRHIVKSVQLCVRNGLEPWLTTNGLLLRQKIDELADAGLRKISIGYYGTGEAYDTYVGQRGSYAALRRGVEYIRRCYGDTITIKIEFLLMRPTCNRRALDDAVAFAREFSIPMTVNLVHYSLPYFKDADGQSLQFTEDDRGQLESFVRRLLEAKRRTPHIINRSEAGLASIPDWLILRERMRIPCDRHGMLWIGPDGSVQLCYVTFPLGNLHDTRLREMVHTPRHLAAIDRCRKLQCPNCHCGYSTRIDGHRRSRRHYGHLHTLEYTGAIE